MVCGVWRVLRVLRHSLNMFTDILTQKDELAHLQGVEISRIIDEQHHLEKRYSFLLLYLFIIV